MVLLLTEIFIGMNRGQGMRVNKRKWIITIIIIVVFLGTIFFCQSHFLMYQKPMYIEVLGDVEIAEVEAGYVSPRGWMHMDLDRSKMARLVRLMNCMKMKPTGDFPAERYSGKRMVFCIERADGGRNRMVLVGQTLTIDGDQAYMLSRKEVRQIEILFDEITV